MTIKEIVELVDPDSLEIVELEEDNIYKASWNVPYVPTLEFDDLLERLSELTDGDIKKSFKHFLTMELEAVQTERTGYPFDFSDHFDARENKIKSILSNLF